MLRSLIVGLGRSGLGLHRPVLRRLAASPDGADVVSREPAVGYDPRPAARRGPLGEDLTMVPDLAAARALLDPAATVVHVCTPPAVRLGVLSDIAALGFRNVVVEKPLAADQESLAGIDRLRGEVGLHLAVVSPWLASSLTGRLRGLVREWGPPRSIHVVGRKPRFRRGLADSGPLTVFDVEIPHALNVALRLAGAAALVDAAWTDLVVGDRVVPRLGAGRLVLDHDAGTRTEIHSDLGAPVRERRIVLDFAAGHAVGHYAVSDADEYAQWEVVSGDGVRRREVFADDSLGAFLLAAYRAFAAGTAATDEVAGDLALHAHTAALLCDAKERCRAAQASRTDPASTDSASTDPASRYAGGRSGGNP